MYKHDTIVRAWLDGKPVQLRNDDNNWVAYGEECRGLYMPSFPSSREFRIKPKPVIKKYRALMWDHLNKKHLLSNRWYTTEKEWEARAYRDPNLIFVRFIEETLKEEEGDYE